MVLKTTQDSSGNVYKRTEAEDLTCPVCLQDVDPGRPKNYTVDPYSKKAVHNGCIDRLNAERDAERGKTL